MKTVTLEQLLIAESALRNLGQPVVRIVGKEAVAVPQSIPLKTSYHVSRLVSIVSEHTRPFHEERLALSKVMGKERPATDAEKAAGCTDEFVYDLRATGKADEFDKQIKEAVAKTIEIDRWLLTLDILEAYQISTPDLTALDPLIVDEAPAAAPAKSKKPKAS
jgi:hypothetical protein